jgi:prepilin-type N-terminal cleavage/methylation domain-containing protein/prepilin-type processing-associated H-X9-DG protein
VQFQDQKQEGISGTISSGFTLLELLVVVAILAILAALLLPVLSKVKTKAKATPCLNNHRQLILGWLQYAHDNDSELMPNQDGIDRPPMVTNWVAGDFVRRPQDGTNEALLLDRQQTLMATYVPSAAVYKCPSDPSQFVRSVSMNCRMNPVRDRGLPSCIGGIGTNFMTYRKLEDIRNPSEIYVLLDERFDSISEGYFAVDMSNTGTLSGDGTANPYYWVDTPASYHDSSVMLAFADGHVATHKWLEASTLGPIGAVGIRRTSSTDRDLNWFQAHTAEPK